MTVPANKLTLPVKVIRKDLMRLAHINSIATYHKCIKELVNYGYIAYTPSFNYYQGCLISLK
ncbi:hypothetical protein FFF34_002940 [Inquilinus sp. KBS0705]|nr:hypothetical protein FFF34_002940 [Inquilinus sp. KBS0705]